MENSKAKSRIDSRLKVISLTVQPAVDNSASGAPHTWASRLVMAGVDLLTVKELGGWRSLKMVERYAHLSPGYLDAAVERLVAPAAGRVELARN